MAPGFREENAEIFLVAFIVSIAFWLTEARYRRYQNVFMERCAELELKLRLIYPEIIKHKDKQDSNILKSYSGAEISKKFKTMRDSVEKDWIAFITKSEIKNIKRKDVVLPHVIFSALSFLLFFYQSCFGR